MMTLEEALAAAPAETVTANDYLVIDPETRKINVPDTEKLFGVRKELNVERKWFKCPKIVGDNIDLSKCSIFVNYVPAKMDGKYEEHEIPGSYLCEDVVEDGENIRFSWLISSNVTRKSGIIAFSVCAKAADDAGRLVTRWHTTAALGEIFDTIQTGEIEEIKDYDLIIQLLNKVDQLNKTVEDYKNEISNIKPAKASRVLWSGYFNGDGYIEFFIPESCFHDKSKQITLLIEACDEYLDIDGTGSIHNKKGDYTVLFSLYFSANENNLGQTYAYAETREAKNSMDGTISMMIKKINTTDYASCRIWFLRGYTSDHQMSIRCISAIVPEDLEVIP